MYIVYIHLYNISPILDRFCIKQIFNMLYIYALCTVYHFFIVKGMILPHEQQPVSIYQISYVVYCTLDIKRHNMQYTLHIFCLL